MLLPRLLPFFGLLRLLQRGSHVLFKCFIVHGFGHITTARIGLMSYSMIALCHFQITSSCKQGAKAGDRLMLDEEEFGDVHVCRLYLSYVSNPKQLPWLPELFVTKKRYHTRDHICSDLALQFSQTNCLFKTHCGGLCFSIKTFQLNSRLRQGDLVRRWKSMLLEVLDQVFGGFLTYH